MDDKKVIIENKSILYICISIIIGFSILSISLFLTSKNDINRYEMISTNEKNIIINMYNSNFVDKGSEDANKSYLRNIFNSAK